MKNPGIVSLECKALVANFGRLVLRCRWRRTCMFLAFQLASKHRREKNGLMPRELQDRRIDLGPTAVFSVFSSFYCSFLSSPFFSLRLFLSSIAWARITESGRSKNIGITSNTCNVSSPEKNSFQKIVFFFT